MVTAVVLLAVAALGGAALLVMLLRGRALPLGLAALHGALAAAGLVALLWAVLQAGAGGLARVALGLFVVAAAGGFVLFAQHLRDRRPSTGLALLHAALAVLAFALLLAGLLGLGG